MTPQERNQVLEEAAKEADNYEYPFEGPFRGSDTAEEAAIQIAVKIRSLKSSPATDPNTKLVDNSRSLVDDAIYQDAAGYQVYKLMKINVGLSKEIKQLREALDQIASWNDGNKVTGSFDEPGSAQIARDALSKMGFKKEEEK